MSLFPAIQKFLSLQGRQYQSPEKAGSKQEEMKHYKECGQQLKNSNFSRKMIVHAKK